MRSPEAPGLIGQLVAAGVCLDICPTSNRLLGVVPDTANHPIGGFLDAGLRCTLNADDPLLFDATILGEYQLARDVLGFDDKRIAGIARTSVEVSAMAEPARAVALAGIESWLAAGDVADDVPVSGTVAAQR